MSKAATQNIFKQYLIADTSKEMMYLKKSGILLSVLLVVSFSTMVLSVSGDWFPPKDMKPPEEFDIIMVGTLDLGENITVYPGTSTIQHDWAVNEKWYDRYDVVYLVPQGNGHYDITVWFIVHNPSKKWAYALQEPDADPDPYTMVNRETFEVSWNFPGSYLWPYAAVCPWDSLRINVVGVRIVADVVASGKIAIRQFGNQIRTDINKDGIVDIRDITIVAMHYGESYPEDSFKEWDMVLDDKITFTDIKAIATEFGREIPP